MGSPEIGVMEIRDNGDLDAFWNLNLNHLEMHTCISK